MNEHSIFDSPWFWFYLAALVLLALIWGMKERDRGYREIVQDKTYEDPTQVRAVLGIVALSIVGFLVFGWKVCLGGIFLALVVGAFFKPRQLLLSTASQVSKAGSAEGRALARAAENPDVRATLKELGRDNKALSELLIVMLSTLQVEPMKAYEAIRDPDLLRWYYTRTKIDEEEMTKLRLWAIHGIEPESEGE